MVRQPHSAPAGSRWGQLADRRAAELLASSRGAPTLVLDVAGGFPCALSDRPGTIVLSALGTSRRRAVRGASRNIPFSSETFVAVIDTTRPEQPADHEGLLRELVRVCRPGGTVALIACGGTAASCGRLAPRSFVSVEEHLRQAGCDIERTVTFDVFAPLSPWRIMLGERRAEVLGELEEHLRFPRVRRAVRLLERHLVAALPPSQGGRVFVVGRRRHQPCRSLEPVVQERSHPSICSILEAGYFSTAVLRFLQDDAVVRGAAFLDAEVLSPSGLPFNLTSYLEDMGARPENAAAAARTLTRWRCWRCSGFEVIRFLTAVIHRMTRQTIAELRDAPDSVSDAVRLPDTLEYEVFSALNTQIERSLSTVPSSCTDP